MKTNVALAAIAAALAAGAAQAQDAAQAGRDLQSMHDILKDNAPQMVVDKDSQTFRSWIDAGFEQSKALLPKATNGATGYAYLLKGYAGGFRDSNITAIPNWAADARWFAVGWPGFSTAWRNGAYVVAATAPGAKNVPPVGAKLVACEGKTAEDIARTRLDRYEGNLELQADRVRTAPLLLWERANPFVGGLPTKCDFEVNGRKRSFNMSYTATPDADREAAYRAAAPVSDGKLSVEPWGAGRIWINVHTLDRGADWNGFFTQVEAQRQAIRDASVVVIDLRGAEDGVGVYGYRLANRLWDPEFTTQYTPRPGQMVLRATPMNRAYYADNAARLKADPGFKTDRTTYDAANEFAAIADQFDKAIAAGQATFNQTMTTPTLPAAPANPMKGKVIVLTDYACSRGCLDAMDLLMKLPNVKQAGTVTSADTIYVEPNTVNLASGQDRLSYPLKAWIDRPRGSNQPFTPDQALTWTGALNDDAGLKAWLDKAVGQ